MNIEVLKRNTMKASLLDPGEGFVLADPNIRSDGEVFLMVSQNHVVLNNDAEKQLVVVNLKNNTLFIVPSDEMVCVVDSISMKVVI